MKLYQLKISIIGIPKLYRIIEASGNCTFDDLHEKIFEAFNRFDPHLYSFFITKSDTKNVHSIMKALEITHPKNTEDFMGFGKKKMSTANTKIDTAQLDEKDVFHYLFDFGDDWWHRILVQSIKKSERKGEIIKIVKAVGESPPQYPEYDDERE